MAIILILLGAFQLNLEAVAGMNFPGASSSNTPAVYFAPGISIPISENWKVAVSVPFWKLTNFNPDNGLPGYVEFPDYVEFDWFWEYTESSAGLLAGARFDAGPIMFQADAGFLKRNIELGMTGCGKSPYLVWDKADDTSFMAAAEVLVPAGKTTMLSLGIRTFDSNWVVTLGTGISFSLLSGSVNNE